MRCALDSPEKRTFIAPFVRFYDHEFVLIETVVLSLQRWLFCVVIRSVIEVSL